MKKLTAILVVITLLVAPMAVFASSQSGTWVFSGVYNIDGGATLLNNEKISGSTSYGMNPGPPISTLMYRVTVRIKASSSTQAVWYSDSNDALYYQSAFASASLPLGPSTTRVGESYHCATANSTTWTLGLSFGY